MSEQNLKEIIRAIAEIVMSTHDDSEKIAQIVRLLIATEVITNNIY